MRFAKVQGLDVVTRITGPTHHYLGIEFSKSLKADRLPVVERLSRDQGEPTLEIVDSDSNLCREVMLGVASANERLGTRLGIVRIRYLAEDSNVPEIYRQLAQALVEHVVERRGPALALDGATQLDDEAIDRSADESFLEYDRCEAEAAVHNPPGL